MTDENAKIDFSKTGFDKIWLNRIREFRDKAKFEADKMEEAAKTAKRKDKSNAV
jgi:hypothetical protein